MSTFWKVILFPVYFPFLMFYYFILFGIYIFRKFSNKDNYYATRNQSNYDRNSSNVFIAIDVETTGLSAEQDEIIEIAAVRYVDDVEVERFNTLVKPKNKISTEITNINGITNFMVMGKPSIKDVLPKFMAFIGDYPLVGHNIYFDIGFIKSHYIKIYKLDSYWLKNECIDTLKMSRMFYPFLPNHKLGTVAEHLGIYMGTKHRAYDDAKASAEIYIKSR